MFVCRNQLEKSLGGLITAMHQMLARSRKVYSLTIVKVCYPGFIVSVIKDTVLEKILNDKVKKDDQKSY